MELFKIKRDIPFMSYGKLTTFISLVTFIAAVFFLVTKGLNFSVEFTGGTVMEVQYQQGADVNKMRERLDTLKIGDVQVQALGTNKHIMIRLPNKEGVTSAQLSNQVMDLLKKDSPDVTLRQVEFIGPQVGEELVSNGLMALGFVVIGIIIYLSMRFEWRFAVSAIIANMHDIVIILGCFAFFQWEFSLTVLAGILAVLGYSVNESVVVFDRIRENFRKPHDARTCRAGSHRQRDYRNDEPHHHYPRFDRGDGCFYAGVRRCGLARLFYGVDHWHRVRHLFFRIGCQPASANVRFEPRQYR